MLVPRTHYDAAVKVARETVETIQLGDPQDSNTQMGPLVSEQQYQRVQALIEKGMAEGARIVVGGPGKPAGLEAGSYAKPTVFADVNNNMTIARQEIFGPVLCMIPYDSIDEAVQIANDTVYGLSAYVYGGSPESALAVGKRLRAGMVHINGAGLDAMAPFGGYKQSGIGREWGAHGIEEFLESKAVMGV
jgi:aldehyde dehydrogenase (NAD+)